MVPVILGRRDADETNSLTCDFPTWKKSTNNFSESQPTTSQKVKTRRWQVAQVIPGRRGAYQTNSWTCDSLTRIKSTNNFSESQETIFQVVHVIAGRRDAWNVIASLPWGGWERERERVCQVVAYRTETLQPECWTLNSNPVPCTLHPAPCTLRPKSQHTTFQVVQVIAGRRDAWNVIASLPSLMMQPPMEGVPPS